MTTSGMPVSGTARWRAEFIGAMKLGWPLILTNLSQAALTATDVILIGRLGPDTLASAVLSTSFYHTTMIFCMGLVTAVMPMVAITLGKNRHSVREVRRTVRQGLWTAIMICVPFWIMLWNAEHIFIALGQRHDVAARSIELMHTLQWALLPYLGYIVLRSFLAALEKPLWTLLIAMMAIAFNALAAWSLIFGHFGLPELGLRGAGIATTMSSWMMFFGLALVIVTHKKFRRYAMFGRFWRPDWPRLLELWRLGLPMGLTFVFESSIFYAAVLMMGKIGPTSLAAHAVAMQIASLSFMVPLGFGQVATVRVGRAYGARDAKGLYYAGWSAYILGIGFMALMALLMTIMPNFFISAFLNLHDPVNVDVIPLAASFLVLAAVFQIFDGGQVVAAGMLRGLQDTRIPMFLALLGYWGIGLPLGAALAFWADWKGIGIWVGLAAGLAMVAVLMTQRWIRRLESETNRLSQLG
ncbi:MATE family multidrug resistance protein [Paenochrobactrum gallinarii]|uniref:Multidrug-efflux transporter n=1 Tax=Paenochrobactrum gallinarii TaxID=643673 RepID=A0A841LTN8_9HYPH|nr:MATE family multidrug resistance protein [Paenochrobactrum gallinarii]